MRKITIGNEFARLLTIFSVCYVICAGPQVYAQETIATVESKSTIVTETDELGTAFRCWKQSLTSNCSISLHKTLDGLLLSVNNIECFDDIPIPERKFRYNMTGKETIDFIGNVLNTDEIYKNVNTIFISNFICMGQYALDCSRTYFASYGNDNFNSDELSRVIMDSALIADINRMLKPFGHKVSGIHIEDVDINENDTFKSANADCDYADITDAPIFNCKLFIYVVNHYVCEPIFIHFKNYTLISSISYETVYHNNCVIDFVRV